MARTGLRLTRSSCIPSSASNSTDRQQPLRSRMPEKLGERACALATGLLVRQVFPRLAAAYAPWLLGHDVRTGSRVAIAGLDQNPATLAGAGQGESSGELAAVQKDGQMARLITDNLGVALIPDDHRARAACLPGPDPLIIAGGQRVVLDRHGQPPDTRIERGPF